MRTLLTALAVAITTGTAAAQPERYELGRRMKLFEAAWNNVADPAGRKRALADLPQATQQFFSFRFGEAGRTLDLAAHALRAEAPPGVTSQWVTSLYPVVEHRLLDGTAKELTVAVKPFYPVKGDLPKNLELHLWFTDKQAVTVKPNKFPCEVKVPLPPLGEFTGLDRKLYVMAEAGKAIHRGAVGVSQVKDVAARVAALKKAVDGWPALDTIEKATVKDRVILLTDLLEGTTPETDFPAADLLTNAEAMLDGKPFFTAAKHGQFWLSVPLGGKKTAPIRVFVPKGLDAAKPVPVVVALHGAGGSENLFFEGYGAGHIVAECEKRGWVLVATRSGLGFGTAPPAVEVLTALATRYPLDLKRAFVVGHSMGAGQTVELVQKHPDRFAAAAALGGSGRVREPKAFATLPVFVGVGSKDFALAGAKSLHKTLTDGGAKAVTFKEYPDVEHLVIVREALPDVFALFDTAAK